MALKHLRERVGDGVAKQAIPKDNKKLVREHKQHRERGPKRYSYTVNDVAALTGLSVGYLRNHPDKYDTPIALASLLMDRAWKGKLPKGELTARLRGINDALLAATQKRMCEVWDCAPVPPKKNTEKLRREACGTCSIRRQELGYLGI